MSASLHRLLRRLRVAAISLICVLITACGAADVSGPESSATEYTSLAVGAFSVNCSGGYAIELDGIDDRIRLDALAMGTPASVTVEAWVRIDESDKVHVVITDARDDFNDGFTLIITASNTVRFTVAFSGSTKASATGTTPMEPGRWYHIAGTYDADAAKVGVLVDGEIEAMVDYEGGVTYASDRGLRFGTQFKGYERNSRFLNGAIDNVRTWNHARTADEISAAMESEIDAASSGLIGYWPMEEGEGATTADMTPAGNTGYLEQGAAWVTTGASDCRGAVTIDVKPGDDPDMPRPIALNPGKIPVAILGAPQFDVAHQLDWASLTFGRTGDEPSLHWRGTATPNCSVDDVNNDGQDDLVCHFLTEKTGLRRGDTVVILKGKGSDGSVEAARMADLAIEASDAVTVRNRGGFEGGGS